ncbi:MAG: hypothetical protein QOJ42_2334 [Acidobacteriaceae bacterium]|nr:hypothetical protein [Acidobacteriaceae bacterium]
MYSTRFGTFENNPDLKPEKSHYVQVGIADTVNGTHVVANAFYAKVVDGIVALPLPFWIDVVADGKFVVTKDFQGQQGCAAPRKIVEYELTAAQPLVLQVSGSTAVAVRLTVTQSPAAKCGAGILVLLAMAWTHAHAEVVGRRPFTDARNPPSKFDGSQQAREGICSGYGLTTSDVLKDDCTALQRLCLTAANGGTPEASDEFLTAVIAFQRYLAVPERGTTQVGMPSMNETFTAVGCTACHRERLSVELIDAAGLARPGEIEPYTDLRSASL